MGRKNVQISCANLPASLRELGCPCAKREILRELRSRFGTVARVETIKIR
jgi:hypothetical protein